MRIVCDAEGNGLLDTLNTLWCFVAYDFDAHKWHQIILKDGNYEAFFKFMDQVELFICHNDIGYDIDAIELVTGYKYRRDIIDTLVMSRTLNPDRKIPEGCPTHVYDPSTDKKKLVGPHGLEAWGYRVAQQKPHIDRWDQWNPKILDRCTEDVGINYKALIMMLEEAGLTLDDLSRISIR